MSDVGIMTRHGNFQVDIEDQILCFDIGYNDIEVRYRRSCIRYLIMYISILNHSDMKNCLYWIGVLRYRRTLYRRIFNHIEVFSSTSDCFDIKESSILSAFQTYSYIKVLCFNIKLEGDSPGPCSCCESCRVACLYHTCLYHFMYYRVCTMYTGIKAGPVAYMFLLFQTRKCIYMYTHIQKCKNQGLMYSTIKVRERHPRPHHEGATVFARG